MYDESVLLEGGVLESKLTATKKDHPSDGEHISSELMIWFASSVLLRANKDQGETCIVVNELLK